MTYTTYSVYVEVSQPGLKWQQTLAYRTAVDQESGSTLISWPVTSHLVIPNMSNDRHALQTACHTLLGL